jgi:hypothetical protein
VLVCYLDDSGKDPQSHITTLAGFVARESDWSAFEQEVEPIFERRGVSVLHTTDLESTNGEFKGWKRLRKQAFVAEFCQVLSRHSTLGVSMSCVKSTYDIRAKQSKRKRTSRPYTFCFNVILDWLLRDIRTGRAVWDEGLAFIIETGHENNPELEQSFHTICKIHKLEQTVRSISFVPKDDSRAIQAADLFAFYSRRDSARYETAMREGKKPQEMEAMLKIIVEKGQFRAFVATDFEPGPLSGMPAWPLPQFRPRPLRSPR